MKVQIKILALLLTVFFSVNANAQTSKKKDKKQFSPRNFTQNTAYKTNADPYIFTLDTVTYQNLSGGTSINNGQIWDDPEYKIPIPFDFYMFGYKVDTLNFDGIGYVYDNVSGDSIRTLIFLTGVDLIDRGDGTSTSVSPLSYKVDGVLGSRILKMEFNNIGSSDGDPNDFMNFQLWLYEGIEMIEIHFGTSSIIDFKNFFSFQDSSAIFGFVSFNDNNDDTYGFSILEGAGSNPSLYDSSTGNPATGLTSIPSSGTVYRFSKNPLANNELLNESAVVLYPNPVFDFVNISVKENATIESVEVYSMTGKHILETKSHAQIDISAFNSGVYTVHIKTNKGTVVKKFVKH